MAGRFARRLVRRAAWQSTLIMIVLALPVAISVAVAAVSATARPTAEERLALFWGSANARLETVSSGAGQPVQVGDPLVLDARVGSVLPSDTKRALDLDITLPLTSAQGRKIDTQGRVLNLADPITHGIYRLDEGAPSNTPHALVLSSALAGTLGVAVGDEVLVDGQPMRLVALISDRQDLTREIAVVPPAAIQPGGPLHSMLNGDRIGTPRWLLQLPDPLDPPSSQELAEYNLAVVDRDDALRRVAPAPLVESAALGLGAGLLLESALMAAAAFIVVARAQRRNIGLLAALGAARRVRSRCVLWYAGLLAVVGAVVGAVLGLLAAAVAIPYLAEQAEQDWGAFRPAFSTLVLLVLAAVVAALIAAWLPARESGHSPVLPMLRENIVGTAHPRSRNISFIAWLALAIVTFVFVWSTGNPILGVGAVVFSVIALVTLLTGRAVVVAANPMPRQPPLIRVVVRSLVAIPTRLTALGVATGLLISIGVAGLVVTSSTAAHRAENYRPPVPLESVLVKTPTALSEEELRVLGATTGAGGVASFVPATTAINSGKDQVLVATPLLRCLEENDQIAGTIRVSNCSEDGISGVVFPRLGIASPAAIETVSGRELDDRAIAVLNAGGAVVISDGVTDGGALDLVRLPRRSAGDDPGALVPLAELPAVQVAAMPQYSQLPVAFVSPDTAEQLGMARGAEFAHALLVPASRSNPLAMSADDVRRVLPTRQQAAAEIVIAAGPSGVDMLRTITTTLLVGTVVVGSTVIGSGVALWGTESRPELSRLTVVGARRGWRLAAGTAHGASIAALACVAGVPPGVIASALFLRSAEVETTIPGAAVVIMVVATLLSAAGVGAAAAPRGAELIRSPL